VETAIVAPTLRVVELDGHRYADLRMAQDAALGDVARALAALVRDGLTGRHLIVVDSVVRLNIDDTSEE
jgi:hypothetical protein